MVPFVVARPGFYPARAAPECDEAVGDRNSLQRWVPLKLEMRGFKNLTHVNVAWRHAHRLRFWALTGRGELISGWRLGRRRVLVTQAIALAGADHYNFWIGEAAKGAGGSGVIYHGRLAIHVKDQAPRIVGIQARDSADLTQFEAVLLAFIPRETPETPAALPEAPEQGSFIALRRRMPKWPFALAGSILAGGVALAFVLPINMPYFALSPGPVSDVTDYIDVPDAAEETGDLFFLTVTLKEVNLLEYVAAWLDSEVDLNPRETIRPAGVSQEELRSQNLSLMESSKQNAVCVALTKLEYDVRCNGTGALVSSVIPGSAADGIILENDIIVELNGMSVQVPEDLFAALAGRAPGEMVLVTVDRGRPDEGRGRVALTVTLGVFRSVDGATVDETRGMIGVRPVQAPAQVEFPVDVVIDSQSIGGPSAGLMFTLEIMNQLTPSDLTNGHRIAGTGTISPEGTVGPIGGVRQKIFGAINAGAEYVLVPRVNYPTAIDAAADDITVVQVDTIDDALAFLGSLPAA